MRLDSNFFSVHSESSELAKTHHFSLELVLKMIGV